MIAVRNSINPVPQVNGMNGELPIIPAQDRADLLNVDMLQQTPYNFNFKSTNVFPAEVDYRNVDVPYLSSGIGMVPTMAPIKDGTMSTTTRTYNQSNINPRTFMNYAQPGTYGSARGEVSLITDPDLNFPGKPLPVNNAEMFRQVALDERMVRVPQRPI